MENKIETILNGLRNKTIDEIVTFDIKDLYIDRLKEETIIRMRKNVRGFFELGDMTPLKKMCCYKISAPDLKIDCDVSLFSIIIYALAFDIEGKIQLQSNSTEKYLIKGIDGITYAGDTMNSYATTTRNYLRDNYHNDEIYNPEEINEKHLRNEYINVSGKKNNNHWDACILDHYNEIEFLLPTYIKKFLSVCHTIGNMIPVPATCFNGPRYKQTEDYWDKTLVGIKNNTFENIVGASDKNVRKCKEWFEKKYNNNWETFVKNTYMTPFIENGKPKELWNGTDYKKFYEIVTNSILERGEMIAKKLKSVLDEKPNEKIINDILNEIKIDK